MNTAGDVAPRHKVARPGYYTMPDKETETFSGISGWNVHKMVLTATLLLVVLLCLGWVSSLAAYEASFLVRPVVRPVVRPIVRPRVVPRTQATFEQGNQVASRAQLKPRAGAGTVAVPDPAPERELAKNLHILRQHIGMLQMKQRAALDGAQYEVAKYYEDKITELKNHDPLYMIYTTSEELEQAIKNEDYRKASELRDMPQRLKVLLPEYNLKGEWVAEILVSGFTEHRLIRDVGVGYVDNLLAGRRRASNHGLQIVFLFDIEGRRQQDPYDKPVANLADFLGEFRGHVQLSNDNPRDDWGGPAWDGIWRNARLLVRDTHVIIQIYNENLKPLTEQKPDTGTLQPSIEIILTRNT